MEMGEVEYHKKDMLRGGILDDKGAVYLFAFLAKLIAEYVLSKASSQLIV